MNVLESLKTNLSVLKNRALSVGSKLQNYKFLITNLEKIKCNNIIIKDEALQNSLLELVSNDICNGSGQVRLSALISLRTFHMCKRKYSHEAEVYDKYIDIIGQEQKSSEITVEAMACFTSIMQEMISQKFTMEQLFSKFCNTENEVKFAKLLEGASSEMSKEHASNFLGRLVIPFLFHTDNQESRRLCIDVANDLLSQAEISTISNDQLQTFKKNIKTKYIPKIGELRITQNSDWKHMCIILLKYSGNMLNSQPDIMNLFLKATQAAFRSNNVNMFLEAYDCWKVIIDTWSLNTEQDNDQKQLMLLVTPLKTNLSKDIRVTERRLELWLHLISISKDKSIEILGQFFNFCFGPLREIPFVTLNSQQHYSLGRYFWKEGTCALLEILGHFQHDTKDSCFQYRDAGARFTLETPIITGKVFIQLGYIIINAIGECSSLILQCTAKDEIPKTINCIWGSLFNTIAHLQQVHQEVALEKVSMVLAVFIQTSKDTPDNWLYVLKPIIQMLLDNKSFPTEMLNKKLVFPMLKSIIKHSDTIITCDHDLLLSLFHFGQFTSNSIDWFEQACALFVKVKSDKSDKDLFILWIKLKDIIINVVSSLTYDSKVMSIVCFMSWPFLQAYQLSIKEQLDLITSWYDIFKEVYKIFPKDASLILQSFQSNLRSLQIKDCSFLLQLVPYLSSHVKAMNDQYLAEDLIKVTSEIFASNLNKEGTELLIPVLEDIIDSLETQTLTKTIFQAFCRCCENGLMHQQLYELLQMLVKFFDTVPNHLIVFIPLSLIKTIKSLITLDNKAYSRNAAIFVNKYGKRATSLMPLSRTAKISSMVITPTDEKEDAADITATSLFNPETTTPQSLRGSLLTNVSKQGNQKSSEAVPKSNRSCIQYDDDEANFEFINKQYKFDPAKLNEHQLEVLKQRSDLPALYQDLSQSQSASQCLPEIVKEADLIYMKDNLKGNSVSTDSKLKGLFKMPTFENSLGQACLTLSPLQQNISEKSTHSIAKEHIQEIENTKTDQPKRRIALTRVLDNLEQSSNKIFSRANLKTGQPHIEKDLSNRTVSDNFENPPENNFISKLQYSVPNTGITESKNDFNGAGVDKPSSNESSNQDNKTLINVNELHISQEKNIQAKNKKLSRVEKELNKIKMDIVGGDAFVQNLDWGNTRKTRKANVNAHPGCTLICGGSKSQCSNDATISANKMKTNRVSTITRSTNKSKKNLTTPLSTAKTVDNTDCDIEVIEGGYLLSNKETTKSKNTFVVVKDKGGRSTNKSNENETICVNAAIKCGSEVSEMDNVAPNKDTKISNNTIVENIVGRSDNRLTEIKTISLSATKTDDTTKCLIEANEEGSIAPKKDNKRSSITALAVKGYDGSLATKSKVNKIKCLNDTKTDYTSKCPIEVTEKCDLLYNYTEKENLSNKETDRSNTTAIVVNDNGGTNISKLNTSVKIKKILLDEISSKVENKTKCGSMIHPTYEELGNNYKRIQDVTEKNTEDVIESSQESYLEITPCKNISTKPNISGISIAYTNSEEMETRKLIKTADISPDQVIQMHLASNKVPTVDYAEMDTVTQEISLNEDVPHIASSPIYADTPTRTKDFIDNTINISPIKLFASANQYEDTKQTEKTPELFESELNEEIIGLSSFNNAKINIQTIKDLSHTKRSSKKRSFSLDGTGASRATKLLKLLSHTLTPPRLTTKVDTLSKHSSTKVASKNGRIAKMMENCPSATQFPDIVEIQDSDDEDHVVLPENNILQFVREAPSPMASPKYSILKRKTPDVSDEGLSPPKKKRVNFCDPPLTSKKVFIKDVNELISSNKNLQKFEILPSDVAHEEIVETYDEAINDELEVDDVIDSEDCIEAESDAPYEAGSDAPYEAELDASYEAESDSPYEVESDISFEAGPDALKTETQGSIHQEQPYLLEDNQSIFPDLVGCAAKVEMVIKDITSPTFMRDTLEELNSKKIFTIGDLSSLTELEINRLPFKSPKILKVKNALEKFLIEQPVQVSNIINQNEIVDDKCKVDIVYEILKNSESLNEIQYQPEVTKSQITDELSNSQTQLLPVSHDAESSLVANEDSIESNEKYLENISEVETQGLQFSMKREIKDRVRADEFLSSIRDNRELFKEETIIYVLGKIVAVNGLSNILDNLLQLPDITGSKLSIDDVFQKFGMERTINGLQSMIQNSEFPLQTLINALISNVSPEIKDFVGSLVTIIVKMIEQQNCTSNELTSALNRNIVQSIKLLLDKLPIELNTREEMLQLIHDKYSFGVMLQFISNTFNNPISDCHVGRSNT